MKKQIESSFHSRTNNISVMTQKIVTRLNNSKFLKNSSQFIISSKLHDVTSLKFKIQSKLKYVI